MHPLTTLFFTLILSACTSIDKNDYRVFLEELTYPDSEWQADDLGQTVSPRSQELLKKFSPQFFVGKNECGPMDFYKQYVPLLRLHHPKEPAADGQPGSRELLKKYERDFESSWRLPDPPVCLQAPNPPLYANAWSEQMQLAGSNESHNIKVLRYGFSFYQSGMPASQPFHQRLGRILGDYDRWHYLDIHGAVFYLLTEENKLFGLVLAQHNHFRSYIIGKDISLEQAKNICFAERSNEPYICHDGAESLKHPAAPNFKNMRWIITGKERPISGANDRVPASTGRQLVKYKLEFLSSRDPLKTSWAALGPNLKIWGMFSTFYRNAAPGMDIFNIPALKEVWKTGQYFYFDSADNRVFDLHEANSENFLNPNIDPVLKINGKRYSDALKSAGWFVN